MPSGYYNGTIRDCAGSVNGSVTLSVYLYIYPPYISASGPITLTAQTGSSTPLKTGIFLSSNDACLVHNFTATASSAGGWLSRHSRVRDSFRDVREHRDHHGGSNRQTGWDIHGHDYNYIADRFQQPDFHPGDAEIGPILTVSPNNF